MNLGERGLFIHFSSVKSHIKIKRKKGEKLIGRKSLVDNTQNTQKEEIFDTFFYSSKNVQMNKKYVLKKNFTRWVKVVKSGGGGGGGKKVESVCLKKKTVKIIPKKWM